MMTMNSLQHTPGAQVQAGMETLLGMNHRAPELAWSCREKSLPTAARHTLRHPGWHGQRSTHCYKTRALKALTYEGLPGNSMF